MGLSNLPNPCFGPDELGLCLGLLRMDVGLTRSPSRYWAGGWIFGLFIYPYQLPPSPCVRIAWARAVIISATVAISTCLLEYGLIEPDRRHTWCVNDGLLGFALVFHTLLVPLCRPPSFEFLWRFNFPFSFIVSVLRFLPDRHLSI